MTGYSGRWIGGFAPRVLLAIWSAGQAAAAQGAERNAEDTQPVLQEIVVTSLRRPQNLQDVPLSVTALNREQLDARGVRTIDDLAALTPGVAFTRSDWRNGSASDISIRGVESRAGASTTGIYIDDTPIQVRLIGASAFNAFPQVFDLQRVEVLRGPQGTLFGAGSEGGTVRFITPQPDLSRASVFVRGELGYTHSGAPSREIGAAFGTPVTDRLAVRVSGWYRRDGGWVDRVAWNRSNSAHEPVAAVDADSNWQNASVLKAAVLWVPSANLTLTPSFYYQSVRLNDTPFFWKDLSQSGRGAFNNGNLLGSPSADRFYLPALKLDWSFDGMRLISNTSYFDRDNRETNDYTVYVSDTWTGIVAGMTGNPAAATPYPPPGYAPAPAYQANHQDNLTEELRLQSADTGARVNWVAGLFFLRARQGASEFVQDSSLPGFLLSQTGVSMEAIFGQGLYQGQYVFYANPIKSRDRQIALFGQADIRLAKRLILTAGLRVADSRVDESASYRGPLVGAPVTDAGSQESFPVTPRVGLSYQVDADHLVYASAAKGFRAGGYNPRVGLLCSQELAALGLPGVMGLYQPDSLWSYELGSKHDFLDHRVQLNASVYYIDWQNIQQAVALQCGFQFVDNLGAAISRGFDLQGEFALTRSLLLDLAVGYTDAKFTRTEKTGPGATTNLVSDGDHLAGWPWTGAASALYDFAVFGGHDGYVRLTWQLQSRQNEQVVRNNPADNAAPIGAGFFQLPRTSQLSARLGVRREGFDVALFGNNLTNEHVILQQMTSPQAIPTEPVIALQSTFRPRTFGLTATFNY